MKHTTKSRLIEKAIKKQKIKILNDVEEVFNDIYQGFFYVIFQNGSPCYSLKVKQSSLFRPNEIFVNGKILCRLTISKSSYFMKLIQYKSYLGRLVPTKCRGKKILDVLLYNTVKKSFKKYGNNFEKYEPRKSDDISMKEIEDSEELKKLGNRSINLEKRIINIEQDDETEEVIEEEEEEEEILTISDEHLYVENGNENVQEELGNEEVEVMEEENQNDVEVINEEEEEEEVEVIEKRNREEEDVFEEENEKDEKDETKEELKKSVSNNKRNSNKKSPRKNVRFC